MREFYLLNSIELFHDKYFAYAEPFEQRVGDTTKHTCPKCGRPVGGLEWLEPRKVKLSKPKYGDFIYGHYVLVTEHFRELYERSGLTGIMSFLPVSVAKVAQLRGKPLPDTQYYALEIVRDGAKLDLNLSKLLGPDSHFVCDVCLPSGTVKNEIDGLFVDLPTWKGDSIFHIYEMGDTVFISQEFVDFCLEHKFTNFKCINTRDFQRLFDRLFEPIDRSKIVGNPPY